MKQSEGCSLAAKKMRTFNQLNPTINIDTPKGAAVAVAVIDYGPDHDLLWVCFQDETGEQWSWKSKDVLAVKNISLGVRANVYPAVQEAIDVFREKIDRYPLG